MLVEKKMMLDHFLLKKAVEKNQEERICCARTRAHCELIFFFGDINIFLSAPRIYFILLRVYQKPSHDNP